MGADIIFVELRLGRIQKCISCEINILKGVLNKRTEIVLLNLVYEIDWKFNKHEYECAQNNSER